MLIKYKKLHWHHFVNPVMLLILYYTLATLIRLWLQEPMEQQEVRESQSLTPLPPPSSAFALAFKVCTVAVLR